jgi:hypothetical protein
MSPVELGTKNHYAGEDQQELSRQPESFSRTSIGSCVPTGPETKNECAGEGQQQFTGFDYGGEIQNFIMEKKVVFIVISEL